MDVRLIIQNSIESIKKEMVGHWYRHFKGNLYQVIAIAIHSETSEPMVIYVSEGTDFYWSRPLDMFCSEVDHVKYPDVKQKMRFEKIE